MRSGLFQEQSNRFSELLSHFRCRPVGDPLLNRGLMLLRCGGAARITSLETKARRDQWSSKFRGTVLELYNLLGQNEKRKE